jgi:UDP-N-acetylmuramoyl-tripeptide--D-alanyl-D-alanine ligase
MMRSRGESWFREVVTGKILSWTRPLVYAAAYVWRRMLTSTTVIGVTGSLGKTTAKECLAEVLAWDGPTFRSFRNQNAPIAVALNILRVRPWHKYAVIEVAGAAPGMMRKSARLLNPDIAIVLNVLRTHTTAFTDLAQHAAEKAVLLSGMSPRGFAVVNEDDPFVAAMQVQPGVRVCRFGTTGSAQFRLSEVSATWPDRLAFTLESEGRPHRMHTQLVGKQWLTSAGAVATAALALGIPAARVSEALARALPFDGRLQPMQLENGAVILRDDYNASIDTIDASLRVLEGATASRRMLVITDMSDFGRNRKQRLKYLASRAGEVADAVVFIGESAEYGMRRAVEGGIAAAEAHAFPSLQPAAEFLRGELRAGDLVLLKGRTTDHAARLFFAQFSTVKCWKHYCSKRMLCDICWELGVSREERMRARPVAAV